MNDETNVSMINIDEKNKRFFAACYAMQGIITTQQAGYKFSEEQLAKVSFKYADELLKQEKNK